MMPGLSFVPSLSWIQSSQIGMTDKFAKQMFYHFLPYVPSHGIASSPDVLKLSSILTKIYKSSILAPMPDCPLVWVQPNMAMTVNIGVYMILLMSQSSISISIQNQLEHPTVIKTISSDPTYMINLNSDTGTIPTVDQHSERTPRV